VPLVDDYHAFNVVSASRRLDDNGNGIGEAGLEYCRIPNTSRLYAVASIDVGELNARCSTIL
jgi:hypothetical protein